MDDTRVHRPLPVLPRLHLIDPFRGLVCLGVVVMHMHQGPMAAKLTDTLGPELEFALRYLRLGVESFFVLSGFFLAHMLRPSEERYLSVSRFTLRRLIRLAVPYWAVLGLSVVVAWAPHLLLNRPTTPPSVWQMSAAAAFCQDILSDRHAVLYPLWSMATLMQYYLVWLAVFWVVRWACLKVDPVGYQVRARRLMVGAAWCLLVGSLGWLLAGPRDGWQLPAWGWMFALGTLTYWQQGRMSRWPIAILLGLPVAAGLIAGEAYCLKATVCSALLFVFGRGYAVPDSMVTRGLGYLGRRSYSIYLVHGLVGVRIVNWSVYLPADRPTVAVGLFVGSIAASVVAGVVFYSLVERPVERLVRTIEYRR